MFSSLWWSPVTLVWDPLSPSTGITERTLEHSYHVRVLLLQNKNLNGMYVRKLLVTPPFICGRYNGGPFDLYHT